MSEEIRYFANVIRLFVKLLVLVFNLDEQNHLILHMIDPHFAGRVLKVDGAHVAVRFPCTRDSKEIKDLTSDDTVNLLQDCRLMRKDELQVSD